MDIITHITTLLLYAVNIIWTSVKFRVDVIWSPLQVLVKILMHTIDEAVVFRLFQRCVSKADQPYNVP